MTGDVDELNPFAGFHLEQQIARRAADCGLQLPSSAIDVIAAHARRVLQANALLHLTTVVEPQAFLERHIGESLEGAAMIDEQSEGLLLDLGSGNGYPGVPIAAVRTKLRAVLVEASARKAAFLRSLVETTLPGGMVIERQVQRADDLAELGLPLRCLVCRAVGNWERTLPRLTGCLEPQGTLLVWAGQTMEQVLGRKPWRRLSLVARHPLPGRERSWIWQFIQAG